MKFNWEALVKFLVTYGPAILQAVEAAHQINQQQQQGK